ncbi:hypothetical protein [Nitrospira moscoviensis]|uniref:Lipoprotein n=1 Tax=Nitrospira moscoviensis TaxID=42253 RepID=A0A0K2GGW7_NITMO|nr:hypothetical protein [Nitrospira moscoviensis]ALA60181.1 hypothetical protein NITMOv2_3791 [Nitrospira moscoviensis]
MKWLGPLLVSILAACTTLTPEQELHLKTIAATPVVCSKGDDCEMKWGRAIAWISRNSQWKIQTQTDNIIQTYTPIGASAASGFLVNKVPLGDGRYEIMMTSGCANFIGCIPDATTLRARFNEFVLGPEALPSVSASPASK